MTILDKASAIEEMQKERLPVIASLLGGVVPGSTAIWRDLTAAEADVASRLKVPLEPTEVFSVVPPTDAEVLALGGRPWLVEPGYDMEGSMLGTFQWGTIQLGHRPLIAVHSVLFVYPTVNEPIYDVPLDWVYPDNKAGVLQFSPKPTASGLAPSLIAANIMARGGAVPQMVRVRYTAGLTPQHQMMPAITDLIMRMAMLRRVKFLPQSTSISSDGLSQSKSFDVDKIGAAIDAELAALRQSLKGPVWGVL